MSGDRPRSRCWRASRRSLLAGLIALQLLAAGYSLTLADGAAEAGAMALAAGRPAAPAVREALPGWARDRVGIEVDGGRLTVRLRPPSPLAAIARRARGQLLGVGAEARGRMSARGPLGAPATGSGPAGLCVAPAGHRRR